MEAAQVAADGDQGWLNGNALNQMKRVRCREVPSHHLPGQMTHAWIGSHPVSNNADSSA